MVSSKLVVFLASAILAVFLGAGDAGAQDVFSDFFGGLFGGGGGGGGGGRHAPSHSDGYSRGDGGRMRRVTPHRERQSPAYWRGESKSAKKKPASKPGTESAGATEETPRVEASFFVAAMGDTLGLMLANGLDEAFEDKPQIAIERKAKESSGLVRDDFYDWPKAARDIASAARKPDVAVMMIGSNDRQSIQDGGGSHEPLSPHWRELYAARVDAVIAAFKEKDIPLIWVGLPVMKNERFSADMNELNGIYRERAARAGIPFVDLWESFADENGRYQAFGPDINGEIVKIRTADGVHFTDAGSRNLAHFVESEIMRVYDAKRPDTPTAAGPTPPQAPTAAATPSSATPPAAPVVFVSPVGAPPAAAPALPDRPPVGPAQPLTAAAVAADELARRAKPAPAGAGAAAARALADHVFVEGGEQTPKPNRADDFSHRAAAPTGATAQ